MTDFSKMTIGTDPEYIITDQTDTTTEQKNLTKLLLSSVVRGEDATGIGYIKRNTLHVIKSAKPATQFIRSRKYKDAIKKTGHIVIGHTRASTKGDAKDNHNNHPVFSRSGIAIIHNGIVSNDDALFTQYNLKRDGIVDSEIILRLIEYYKLKHCTTRKAIQKACKEIRGSMAVALIDIHEPDTLYLFTRTSPVTLAYDKERHTIYFASTEDIITNSLIHRKKLLGFFQTTLNRKHFIYQELENNTGLVVKHNKITSFKIDEPDWYSTYDETHHESYSRQPTLPAIITPTDTKETVFAKLEQHRKDKEAEKELDRENKEIQRQVDDWQLTPIEKPSKATTAQIEERSAVLEDRDIAYRADGTGQPLTMAEQQELKRLQNTLDDRYKQETIEETNRTNAIVYGGSYHNNDFEKRYN